MTKETFKVRDLRIKEKFWLDDVYLNGYARYLKPTATAVYLSLCRHADKEQSCFPAEVTIAEEHGISERTVRSKIALLQSWNIIKVKRTRSQKGKWLHNTYFLLDKSEWRKPQAKFASGSSIGKKEQNQRQQLPHKDSHSKVAYIKREINKEKELIPLKGKYSSLESLGEAEFQQIAEDYQVPIEFVRSKYDDLVNYVPNKTGKPYKDYFAALRNFVKKEAIQIRKEAGEHVSKRGIDARNVK